MIYHDEDSLEAHRYLQSLRYLQPTAPPGRVCRTPEDDRQAAQDLEEWISQFPPRPEPVMPGDAGDRL